MRRSKVQRQEVRRERRLSFRAERREKTDTVQERWMVALASDCRVPKYPFRSAPVGFDEPIAHRLAELAPGGPKYAVLPLAVFDWARAQGEPMSVERALRDYKPEEDVDS